jgi:hypothetical protein
LKRASQHGHGGKFIYCRVCGRSMDQAPVHWAYRLPFEVWAVVARYNLKPDVVRRYLCPDRHSQAWFVPSSGERPCDVLVTKGYRVG